MKRLVETKISVLGVADVSEDAQKSQQLVSGQGNSDMSSLEHLKVGRSLI